MTTRDETVFSQADALMRRHRSFLARGNGHTSEDSSELTGRMDDVDIPLLTEVVELAETTASATLLSRMQQTIESEVDLWLAKALPQYLTQLTEKLGTQLQADLDEEIRNTLLPKLLASLVEKQEEKQGKM